MPVYKFSKFLLSILFFIYSSLLCQIDSAKTSLVKTTTTNGNIFYGRFIKTGLDSVSFITGKNEVIKFARDEISSVEKIEAVPDTTLVTGDTLKIQKEYYPDHHTNKLFLLPTGRPILGGSFNLSLNELIFPMAGIGVADIVSFGVGTNILNFSGEPIIFFTPKITFINYEGLTVAAGAFIANSFEGFSKSSNRSGINLYYGVASFTYKKFSITSGIFHNRKESFISDEGAFLIGGEFEIGRNAKIISENIFPSGSTTSLNIFGLRFWSKRVTAEFGMILSTTSGKRNGSAPWLAFSYNILLW